ncbi:GDSL-type esterase/lipase family protein [Shewanella sp. UCD-KL12]|uniref:GDSL-type esterase/lipase family protein n=1 Tax=Shewanella sp. UCD-KL12 TaxID=1917163 RepID=UPI000970CA24|nr:GDSL-type esterase/lipase family protein [Shewanella sp. UCD-KL12]
MKRQLMCRIATQMLVLVSLLLLQACSKVSMPALSDNAQILAFGDSLTYGKGARDGGDYPAVLSELTGMRVINAGVSGETTTQGLTRLTALLAQEEPELLILLEGGNDFLRNHDLAKTKANLAAMIEQAQVRSIPVLLLAVPQKSIFLSPAEIYSELAEEYELVFMEETLTDLLKTPSMKSDTIHLNNQGYQALATAIHDKLMQAGAL